MTEHIAVSEYFGAFLTIVEVDYICGQEKLDQAEAVKRDWKDVLKLKPSMTTCIV